jgi:Icc-related predicted phosphoesterase
MSTPNRHGLDVEAILNDLHLSKVKASLSLSCEERIEVKLGDLLNGCDAEAKVSTLAEAAEWLRDKALMHYPRSEFAGKYAGFDQAHVNTGMRWSEMDLVDLGHMLTRELPIKEIASHLCRSPAEVRDKIVELGRACHEDRSRHHHRGRRLALVER